jgi:hypothetical protein
VGFSFSAGEPIRPSIRIRCRNTTIYNYSRSLDRRLDLGHCLASWLVGACFCAWCSNDPKKHLSTARALLSAVTINRQTLSRHRMLSFSMGTRVRLIFFLSAAVPLNFFDGRQSKRQPALRSSPPSSSASGCRKPCAISGVRLVRRLFARLVIPLASEFSL